MHADEATPHPQSSPKPVLIARIVLWVLAWLASLAVFSAYLEPSLMVTLGNAIWSCF